MIVIRRARKGSPSGWGLYNLLEQNKGGGGPGSLVVKCWWWSSACHVFILLRQDQNARSDALVLCPSVQVVPVTFNHSDILIVGMLYWVQRRPWPGYRALEDGEFRNYLRDNLKISLRSKGKVCLVINPDIEWNWNWCTWIASVFFIVINPNNMLCPSVFTWVDFNMGKWIV